jgi:hypothetical protein
MINPLGSVTKNPLGSDNRTMITWLMVTRWVIFTLWVTVPLGLIIPNGTMILVAIWVLKT